MGAALSRLGNIASADEPTTSQKYASYTYLGAGTVVKVAYPAVTGTLALTYRTSGDGYSGFDPALPQGLRRASRFGRVVNQKWQTQGETPVVKDRYTYGYDLAGNRVSRDPAADSHTPPDANDNYYTYDGLDRLVKSNWGTLDGSGVITDQNADANQAWGLDPVGNWSGFQSDAGDGGTWDHEQTRDHNKANEIADGDDQDSDAIEQVTGAKWLDPAYDQAGNMTKGPKPGDESTGTSTQWYKYDAWNRLTRLGQGASSPGTTVATYSYDPASPRGLRRAGGQNRRIRKVVAATPSNITYDYYYNESWQVLEVRKGESQNAYQQYVWGIQYVDAPVVSFLDGNLDGDVADVGTDYTLYYTYDGNFNVTAMIKPDGTVAERYTYDPYGKVTFKAADWSDAASQAKSAYDNEVLYCGYRFDPESGNHLARRRYLTPPLGRWLTTDPIGYGDGMGLYEYTTSNPEVRIDPWGTDDTIPLNKYWEGWKKSHPGLTNEEYNRGYDLLGRGCIGIAQLELGHKITSKDLDECYDTLERAKAKQNMLKETGKCCDQDAKGQTGQFLLFFLDFWAGSDQDVRSSGGLLRNKKVDFPVDKKTGHVDMKKWRDDSWRNAKYPAPEVGGG